MEKPLCPDCAAVLKRICLWYENGVELYLICPKCGFEKQEEGYHNLMAPQKIKAIVGG